MATIMLLFELQLRRIRMHSKVVTKITYNNGSPEGCPSSVLTMGFLELTDANGDTKEVWIDPFDENGLRNALEGLTLADSPNTRLDDIIEQIAAHRFALQEFISQKLVAKLDKDGDGHWMTPDGQSIELYMEGPDGPTDTAEVFAQLRDEVEREGVSQVVEANEPTIEPERFPPPTTNEHTAETRDTSAESPLTTTTQRSTPVRTTNPGGNNMAAPPPQKVERDFSWGV